MVSPANGWYVGKIHAADGTRQLLRTASTWTSPVDTGYRIYVYYRATGGDPWSALRRCAAGTVDVTAPASTRSASPPPPAPRARPRAPACRSAWTTNPAVASGQFSIWVVTPRQRLVRGHDRTPPTAPQLRTTASTVNVPVDTGYRIYVYYRAASGDPWTHLRRCAAGTVERDRGRLQRDHRHRPHRHHEPGPGRQPAGHLDDQRRGRLAAQFSIWVVSPANGWYGGTIVAADGTASYCATASTVERAGRHRLPHLRLLPRHAAATPGRIYGYAAGTVERDRRRLQRHHRHRPPRARRARPRAPASPVTWTTNAAVATRPVQHLGGEPRRRLVRGHRSSSPTARASYSRQRRPRTCRSTPATSVYVYYRATTATPGASTASPRARST